jgi:uncharacterized protein with ParB-like and HNH nuclease domain
MKTENKSIEEFISQNSTSFFIPPFQRAYAWGRSEIDRYFSDVTKIIESQLSNEEKKKEHFFGTLVIKKENDSLDNRSIIVDGQQRVTTTLLMLIALRDLEDNPDHKSHIEHKYLFNNSSNLENKIKLKQVTKDWDAYKAIVNSQSSISGNITRAYELFKKLISNYRKEYPNVEFKDFIKAFGKLNVSIIILDEAPHKGEDPQMIFETLNSLGRPLELSDLIRNYILLEYDSKSQTDLYENVWHPRIEKILKDDLSAFFRDYLQLRLCMPLKTINHDNTKELYRKFKEYVGKYDSTKRVFIGEILTLVDAYSWIVNNENDNIITENKKVDVEIKELLNNIFIDIKSDAFKPFVLGLLEIFMTRKVQSFDDRRLLSLLKDIRTYLIRRRVASLNKGENKYLVTCCKSLKEIASGDKHIFNLLSDSFYKLRIPNDTEISNTLSELDFYQELKKYAKLILGKIEQNESKVAVDFRRPDITIEHIMPQTLTNQWKDELGKNWESTHTDYLHNIGNLILTEFNSEIGNKSFNVKKRELDKSNLNYRFAITKKTKWNLKSIQEHQSNMIELFIKTFPLPTPYNKSDNWKVKVDDEFILFGDNEMVDHTKPKSLQIGDISYVTKTWQEVFLTFLRHLYIQNPQDLDSVIEMQNVLFNKSNVIIRMKQAREVLDESKVKNYKMLDGSEVSLFDKYNDEDLIIHTAITASDCNARIYAIMESLCIPNEYARLMLK